MAIWLSGRGLLVQVGQRYGLDSELARQKAAQVIRKWDVVKQATERAGYRYGMPPHRMGRELREEVTTIGKYFLEGSRYPDKHGKVSGCGMDVLKTISAEPGSRDFEEWKAFLDAKV